MDKISQESKKDSSRWNERHQGSRATNQESKGAFGKPKVRP